MALKGSNEFREARTTEMPIVLSSWPRLGTGVKVLAGYQYHWHDASFTFRKISKSSLNFMYSEFLRILSTAFTTGGPPLRTIWRKTSWEVDIIVILDVTAASKKIMSISSFLIVQRRHSSMEALNAQHE